MIDTSYLSQLAKFSLVLNKRVTSKYSGPRKSIALGRGIIFKDHRVYAPGDDFRAIAWKVFARTDDLMIKTFEEERSLVVHVIIDSSASMNFGKQITKFDYASMLGVGFAYLAMKGNEKFMFSTFAESLEVFRPNRGMSQLASMVHHLNKLKTEGTSKVLEAITQYRKVIGSRAMIFLISDFLIDPSEVIKAVQLFGRNQVKVIQVLDPVEKDLKFSGDFKLEDSETKEKLRTYISQRSRMGYQKMLDEHISKIDDACTSLGINFYTITTDTSIFDAFYKILG